MLVNIEELEAREDKSLDIDFSELLQEINPSKETKAELFVESKGACVEVSGSIHAEVELECDRCLEKFTLPLNIDVFEVFVKDEAFDYAQNEIELKNDNFVVELYGDNEIDISDLVYQSVILNIPNKKICTKECSGVDELKKIKEEIIDPRLAVFKDISKEIK